MNLISMAKKIINKQTKTSTISIQDVLYRIIGRTQNMSVGLLNAYFLLSAKTKAK